MTFEHHKTAQCVAVDRASVDIVSDLLCFCIFDKHFFTANFTDFCLHVNELFFIVRLWYVALELQLPFRHVVIMIAIANCYSLNSLPIRSRQEVCGYEGVAVCCCWHNTMMSDSDF